MFLFNVIVCCLFQCCVTYTCITAHIIAALPFHRVGIGSELFWRIQTYTELYELLIFYNNAMLCGSCATNQLTDSLTIPAVIKDPDVSF